MAPRQEGADNARPSRVEVTYECEGRMYRVALDPTHLPVFFFSRRVRDRIWGSGAPARVLRTPDDWERANECLDGALLLEGPEEVDAVQGSGDCFCFEDRRGTRYCVCGMT